MTGEVLSAAQYLAGADNVYVLEAFARSQKRFSYNFGEDISGYTFTCDFQSILLDQVSYARTGTGEPDFENTNVIGYFNNYSTVTGAFFQYYPVDGLTWFTIPAYRYTGKLLPHAKNNVVATVVSVEWVTPDGDSEAHRYVILERWEPGVEVGDPTTNTTPQYLASWQPTAPIPFNISYVGVEPAAIEFVEAPQDEGYYIVESDGDYAATIRMPSKTSVDVVKISTGDLAYTFTVADTIGAIAVKNGYLFIGHSNTVEKYSLTSGNLLYTLDEGLLPGARYGYSISADGNYVVVGTQPTTGLSVNVYVYDFVTGSLVQTLSEGSVSTDDDYGWSVAIEGNYLIVGAPKELRGAVWVYDTTTWVGTKVMHLDYANGSNSLFGQKVVTNGTYTAIAGPGYRTFNSLNLGRIYVMDNATRTLQYMLDDPTPSSNEFFGSRMTIEGNYLVVGNPNNDVGGGDNGAVYVYDITTGELIYNILNPTQSVGGQFGNGASMSGNNLIAVSFPQPTGNGKIYYFNLAL